MKKLILITALALGFTTANAGTMRYGLKTGDHQIGYVEVVPLNTAGKFSIYFSADNKRFLIIDKNKEVVEFNYADASALRKDILKVNSFGTDKGISIGCQEENVQVNDVINGCILEMPIHFQ